MRPMHQPRRPRSSPWGGLPASQGHPDARADACVYCGRRAHASPPSGSGPSGAVAGRTVA